MPTLNPRDSVTLQPGLAAVLRRLSELTGNSQSALIGELLAESQPLFERMAVVLEAAAKIKDRANEDIREGLERAQANLEGQLGLVLDDFDVASRPILEAAEAISRRGVKAGGKRSAPAAPLRAPTPMSNRGVTPHPKRSGQQPAKAPRKGARRGQV